MNRQDLGQKGKHTPGENREDIGCKGNPKQGWRKTKERKSEFGGLTGGERARERERLKKEKACRRKRAKQVEPTSKRLINF